MPLSKINRPGLNTGIADSSDATAIAINSSEQVGIGVSNPVYKLQIEQDVNQTPFLYIRNTGNNGCHDAIMLESSTTVDKNIGIRFKNSGGVKGGIGYIQNGTMALYGGTTTSAGVNVNGNGQVTMPNQPVYSASDSRTLQVSNGVLTSSNFYNTPHVNVGNHMNTGTGNFTCPVAGVYRIYFRATHTNSGCNVRLQKNGSTINEAYSDAVGSTYSVSSEAVVSCAANDTLRIQVHSVHANGGSQHKQVTFQLLH